MAKKTLMNNFRNGGKPKKRIIFAETPKRTVLENRYLDTRTNKEIPESEFKKRRVVGYNYTGREDLDKAIFEEILGALSSDVNYADFTDYMLSNYGIDFSNKDSFKVRYDSVYNAFGDDFEREIAKFSTELANSSLIKDFANASKEFLKEPVYENAKIEYVEKKVPDNTFVNEAKKAARASMEIDGVPTEIVPFYGEEEFKNISQKYNKNALKNADVILLGHAGSKIAGIKNEVWNSYLKENMDKDSTCYGGICGGYAMAIDFKDVPNFTGTISNKWIGIPEYKTFKGKGSFADIFFSNVEDESYQVAAVKPKYGREYANYQKNPELIPTIRDEFGRIVRSSQLVEIPTQVLSPLQVQPPAQIPTLRTQVRMQDGGNIKKYQNGSKPKPIIVDDPNDPRLQSYRDSLDLYNFYKLQRQLEPKYTPPLYQRAYSKLAEYSGFNNLMGNLLKLPDLDSEHKKEYLSTIQKIQSSGGDKNIIDNVILSYGNYLKKRDPKFKTPTHKGSEWFNSWKQSADSILKNSSKKGRIENIEETWDSLGKSGYKNYNDFKSKHEQLWAYGDSIVKNNPNIMWLNPLNSPDLIHTGDIEPSGSWQGLAKNNSLMYPPRQPVIYKQKSGTKNSNTISSNVKPTLPNPRQKLSINQLETEIVELPIEEPQLDLKLSGRMIRPRFLERGESIQASPSIPNVDIIFKRVGNQNIPIALQNQLGQRIPYNESERGEVDLRAFQYPGSFEDGGQINKYQNGGKNKLSKSELDLYNKYKAYVGSDIYLNRLKNFRSLQDAELEQYISLDRLRRAGSPTISPVSLPNQIQGWYENPSVINGIGNIILSPRRDNYTYVHEMDHLNRSGGDRYNNAELSLLRGMNRNDSKLSKDQLDYLQDPRESGAKLSNLRSAAVELGIHQEFGEEFTEEQLQKLLEKVKENKSFKFIEAYNPKYLLQALNTIADRGERQVVPIAQNGGGYSWSNPSEGAATVTTPTRSQQTKSERKDLVDNEYKRKHTITEHEKFKSIPRDTINEIVPPKGFELDEQSLKKRFLLDPNTRVFLQNKLKDYSFEEEEEFGKVFIDLYNKGKYDEIIKLVGLTDEQFSEFKDKMLPITLLANELGVKEVRPTSSNRLKRIIGNSPMFDFDNQIIYADYPHQVVQELGHAKQKKEGDNIYKMYFNDWLKNPFFSRQEYKKLYSIPGSFEHDAHSIIEPQIRSTLSGMDSLLIGEYKNGGNSQNNTMKNTKFPTLGRFMHQQGGNIKKYQNSGRVSQRDSIQHQAEKILKYEQLRGGPGGSPLPSYSDPKYLDMLMKEILPEVERIMPNATAIEKAEAMDFIFNAGYDKANKKITKDPRAYALQEYYRKYDPSKLDKEGKWPGRKNPAYSFDEEYNMTIGKLPENERRVLMNKGRDWYYKNINNPAPGVYSPDYESTWYGRIWNTNDYSEFNPNNPNFIPKKQNGGLNYLFPYTDTFVNSEKPDEEIKNFIKKNEGSEIDKEGRHKMYPDSEGHPTIGYGHLVRGVEAPLISQEIADDMFNTDYRIHRKYAEKIPGFNKLTEQQQAALIDMTFNMGENWYKKFPKFAEALSRGDLDKATKELKDSLWYKQVGPRARKVISMLNNKSDFRQGGRINKYQNSGFADNNSLDCIEIGGKTFCKRPGKENEGYYLKEGNFYYRAPDVYAKDEDRPYDYDTQGNKTEQYGWSPSSPMGEEELDYMKKQRQYMRGQVIPYDEFTNPDYKYPSKYEFKGKDFELDYYKFLHDKHNKYGKEYFHPEDLEDYYRYYEKNKKKFNEKSNEGIKPNIYERKNGGMINKFMYQQGGYGQGYGELQGDAGKLLREIMMGTTTSGMFDKQTGTYSKISTADYLKEKGYSAPYAKKDWIGNTVMYVKDPAGNEVKVKDFDKEVEAYNAAKAAEFKSNQEQFNKFLPLTQNLAGLFDLQQREQEEIANKKLTVRDFPTSNSTYAPVGFAQDGGGMQSAQDPMPSLQAIMNGLPRGMSKKHKEMVKNNADKELFVMQQALGYKDNSPFRNLPEQDIYSDTIDMNNVSIPLAAISDNGIAKILPPNSGTHIFKGAQVVKEIPVDMAQQGMLVQDDNQEMIIGVIDLLRQIEDPQNRQEVAIKKLEELLAEGIQVDQEAFMQAVMEDGNNIKDDEEDDDSISMEEVDEDSFEMGDEVEEMRDGGMPQRYKDMGFTKVNTPKRTPNHGSKSHAVVVKDGSSYKLIRFGQKGVSGSPRKPGESEAYRKRRESFKARHAKNIAKGKTSAAYWADKVKWEDGGMPNVGMTMPQYMNSGFAKSNYNNGDASALFINTPLAKNGFFSRLGKGIKKVARGVGNAFHDWGMMLADNVGNEFGIYDIDNERYKTKFGRSLAGINEKIQPVVGKIKGAIASAAVPGMSGVFNLKNSMGAGMNQQQSAAASPYRYSPNFAMPQNNNADQLRMLMNFAPMLLGSQSPFSSGAGSQMLPGFFQNGGGSDEEPKRMSSSINNMQGIIGEAPTNMSERMPSSNMSYRQTSASSKAPTAGRELTGQDRELTNQDSYLADLQQYVMTYGLSALEKADPEAADFYTNAALLAANNYNNEDEEEDDNGIILPEIVKAAKRPDNKKGTKVKKSKEYEYNSYLELEFPKSKSDFLLNNFGIKFSDIGKSVNANMDDSLANLTNVLRNLLSRDSQVLIYDPRNVAQSPTIYGPTASAKNGLMVRKYKQGGSVFNKDLVANDDSMAKHYLPIPLMIPIQTEIKETIVLPTKDLVKVNAKKRHSKMSDNEVTDVVPENSYILSQFGDTKIYKDEANQIVMEMKAEPYNLHKASAVPKVRTLGDMMNKNVMSPADLSRVVSNKFKIIDNGDDPFTIQTNEANRFNRAAYLEAIIGLSEYDKARKGIDNSISAQTQAGQLPQMVARQGGFAKPLVMNGGVLPKAVDPLSLALSAVPQIISTAFNIGANIADRNRLKKNTRLNAADISRYANTARQNLGLSAMTQGLFTAMQDTNIIPELKDVNYLDAINNMNMAYVNTVANRLASDAFSNRLDVSSMSPQSAMYLAGRDTAQRYEALGKASADLAKTRADLFTKYMTTRGELLNENAGMRAKAANLRTAAQNAKLGTFGGIFSGYLDNLIGATKNEIEANMANRGNYAARLSDLNSSLGQSLQNTANVIAQSQNRSKTESEARAAEKRARCAERGGQWIIHPDGTQECSK